MSWKNARRRSAEPAEVAPVRVLAQAIALRAPSELLEFEANAQVHPPRQLEALCRAFQRFGFRIPILVDARGVIIAGHARNAAAKLLGMPLVPTVLIDDLSADEVRALRVADNQIARLASSDDELLARELEELGARIAIDESLGFTQHDVDDLLASIQPKEPTPPAGPEEPPRAPTYQTVERMALEGDLWQLGPHRVVCGDSKSPENFARLVGSHAPALLVADPPYCSGSYQESGKAAGTWGDVARDNLSSKGYQSLLREVLQVAKPSAAYVFTDWKLWSALFDVVESGGIAVRSMIVWAKPAPSLGALWRAQHELVLFGSRVSARRRSGAEAFGNVIESKRVRNEFHYTEKPVELLRRLLQGDAVSERRKCPVYDPFAGSGSLLVAAELEGRQYFGQEVEPLFVDVLLQRWRTLRPDVVPVLEGGGTFEEVRAERASARK